MSDSSESRFNYSKSGGDVEEAIARLDRGELIIAHNLRVYAVVGNANSPTVLQDMQDLKKDPARAAVGWTVPFERAMPYVDTQAVTAEPLGQLVSSARLQTELFGGLGFLRLPAKPQSPDAWIVQSGIVNAERNTIQPYSPTGSDFMSRFLRLCVTSGIEPVMTSANLHGSPEIVFDEMAKEFAGRLDAENPLFILEDGIKATAETRGLGSYPIVEICAGADRPELRRVSGFTPELMERIFYEYDLNIYPDVQTSPKYEDTLFSSEDLLPKYRKLDLIGRQLRLGILATQGSDAVAEQLLDDELSA